MQLLVSPKSIRSFLLLTKTNHKPNRVPQASTPFADLLVLKMADSAKPKPQRKPAEHPGFAKMSAEAIAALKERNGSSLAAIKKYIGEHYKGKLPAHWEKMVTVQLRRMADKGDLVKVKGSYKLGESLKHPKKKKAAAAPKKKAAAEGGEKKKKAAPKKPAAKPKKAAAPKKKSTPKKKAAGGKPKKAAAPKPKKTATKKKAAPKKAAKAKKAAA